MEGPTKAGYHPQHLEDANELADQIGELKLNQKITRSNSNPINVNEANRVSYFPDSEEYIEPDQYSPHSPLTPNPKPLPIPKKKSTNNTSENLKNQGNVDSTAQVKSDSIKEQEYESGARNQQDYDSNMDNYAIHRNLKNTQKVTRSQDNMKYQDQDEKFRERRPSVAPKISKNFEADGYYAETRSLPSNDPNINYKSSREVHSISNSPQQPPTSKSSYQTDPRTSPRPSSIDHDSMSSRPNSVRENPRASSRSLTDSAARSSFSSSMPSINPTSPSEQSRKAKIPTKEALEIYRQNAKKSHDPEVQLDFAKYLIETAALVLANTDDQVDPQTARKLHNTLITEALKWIKRLSSQGIGLGKGAYPDAQFFLANCYNNGSLGLPVDHDKAFNLYVQASKQNHPAATYRTGVCYEFGAGTKRDHHRALQFFRKAAALGDTAAMFKVGMVLLKGGLSQQSNPREGITWLKRAAAAADEENPHALHELASCYEKGGIPSIIADESYSRELYTQAAQFGYAHSQFKMGVCYEQGLLTCPVDPRRSIAWFTRGAEQGDPECELALSGWYLTGSEGVLKQSDTEAYLWARKAADKGLAKAEYAVGYYSEVGIGVKQDVEEARRWLMRSAAQGNKRAMQRLTELKKLGSGRKYSSKSKDDAGCTIS